MKSRPEYVIGIDEVGRGPLAGPVAVGVFCIRRSALAALLARGTKATGCAATDSKAMTARAREAWTHFIRQEQKLGTCTFAVCTASAKRIDHKGIAVMIRACIVQGLTKVCVEDASKYMVLLDGGLRAPAQFEHQQTIIKGDAKEAVISLASIVAKTHRDAYMKKLARSMPLYGFERHVGYGTKVHREALLKYGPSAEHRLSFLTKCLSAKTI